MRQVVRKGVLVGLALASVLSLAQAASGSAGSWGMAPLPTGTTEKLDFVVSKLGTDKHGTGYLNVVEFAYQQTSHLGGSVSMRCLKQCGLRFQQQLDLFPLGVMVSAHDRTAGTVHVASVWEGASRDIVVIYEVSATKVREILNVPTKGWPRFTRDKVGREQVILADDLDEKQPLHVWTWIGNDFKESW